VGVTHIGGGGYYVWAKKLYLGLVPITTVQHRRDERERQKESSRVQGKAPTEPEREEPSIAHITLTSLCVALLCVNENSEKIYDFPSCRRKQRRREPGTHTHDTHTQNKKNRSLIAVGGTRGERFQRGTATIAHIMCAYGWPRYIYFSPIYS
jgi:hypothetical protein